MLLSPVLQNEQECFFIPVNIKLSVWQFLTLESEQQRMHKTHFGMSYQSRYSLSSEEVCGGRDQTGSHPARAIGWSST
jgi:hypothetical protein